MISLIVLLAGASKMLEGPKLLTVRLITGTLGKWNGMYVLHLPDQHKGKRVKSDAAPAANLANNTSKQDNKSGSTAADLQLQ